MPIRAHYFLPFKRYALPAFLIGLLMVGYGLQMILSAEWVRPLIFPAVELIQPKSAFDFLSGIVSLFSYALLHNDLIHLSVNALLIFLFTIQLEKNISSTQIFLIFFFTIASAALAHLMTHPAHMTLIGASGGASGLAGAWLYFHFRDRKTFILLAIGWMLLNYPSLYGSTLYGSANIAWEAHIGGFIAGILCAATIEILEIKT